MVTRLATKTVEKYLQIFPAVVILGSRQCGKSTLIKMLEQERTDLLYLDLQNRADLQKLQDPMLFFQSNEQRIICLDEIQLVPELFSYLRSEIDRARRPGRFILLGSASGKLVQHTGETLAGRVGMIDLTPFLVTEVDGLPDYQLTKYWFRGAYPDSYLALDDEASSLWRTNFIRTYLERDIPQLGFLIAAPKMLRLLTMLAHEHGSMLNYANLANAMDVTAPTIRHYVDLMEETYIVRTLPPYYKNIKKRLTKTPRVYLRDCGLLHELLGITDFNALLGHPIFGLSWEGLVVEQVCAVVGRAQVSYYRTANGSEEMDLVIQYPDRLIAIECKASTAPQVTNGFWKAIETLQPDMTYIVCPTHETYSLRDNVQVLGIESLLRLLA